MTPKSDRVVVKIYPYRGIWNRYRVIMEAGPISMPRIVGYSRHFGDAKRKAMEALHEELGPPEQPIPIETPTAERRREA